MAGTRESDLESLRAQRLQELQQQIQEQAMQQMVNEEEAQRTAVAKASVDAVMKTILSSEARARLLRIGMADPTRAHTVKQQLAELHASGQLNSIMSDAQLKQWLASQSKSRNNASIRRI